MQYQHIPMTTSRGRINMPDRFDLMNSSRFRISFAKVLLDTEAQQVVLDFSEVHYIDSMGIGTLIAWNNNCKESGKALVLENCSDTIADILRRMGVDKLFMFS